MNLKRSVKGLLICIFSFIVNMSMAIGKLIISLKSNSITIMADCVNNFGDSISNIANAYGFSIVNKKPNSKRPFGYGRIEYIFTIMTSFVVLLLAILFLKNALERFFVRVQINYRSLWFTLLLIAAVIKASMGIFYFVVNKKIKSPVIKAMVLDSFQDTLISLVTALSFKWSNTSSIPIDAYIALFVGIFIIAQTIHLIYTMSKLLLGNNYNFDITNKIVNAALNQDIVYINNFNIHDYGNDAYYVTLDAYLDNNDKLLNINEMTKNINEIINDKKIHITINYLITDYKNENIDNLRNAQKALIAITPTAFFDIKDNTLFVNVAGTKQVKHHDELENALKNNNIKCEIIYNI